jgi:hypothetical protein
MYIGSPRQIVLRDAALGAKLAQPLTKRDAGGLRVLIQVLHPAMLDGGCQSVQSGLVGSALV